MQFQKAARKRAKLRLALSGPSGSGKTHSALLIAKGLGGRICVIDTERGSASLYSDLVDFDTLELEPPFSPERFIKAIEAATEAKYDVCILDSITHEWDGSGGCLEMNEKIANVKFRGNTWAAWNETTPRHRAFLDAILQAPMHVIATIRSKTETIQGDDKKVKKLGMKAVQREGVEYEFTVVLDLEHEKHHAVASKDRTRLFTEPHVITTKTGERLAAWLESGAPMAEEPQKAAHELKGDALTVDPELARQTAVRMMAVLEDDASEAAIALSALDLHEELKANHDLYVAASHLLETEMRTGFKKYIEIGKSLAAAEKKERAFR
jgi:AAA domain